MSQLAGRVMVLSLGMGALVGACAPEVGGRSNGGVGGDNDKGGASGAAGARGGAAGGRASGGAAGNGGASGGTAGSSSGPDASVSGDARDASGAGSDGAAGPADAAPRIVQTQILPIIMLDVPGKATPDMLAPLTAKVPGRVRIIENHDGTLMDLAGKTPVLDSPAGIELHGSSSRGFPQKSFNFETRDAADMSKDMPVLGLPKGSDWTLVACWNDKTCMRNAVAYAMGGEFGRWSPRLLFVEVMYNGQYQGLYQLVEAIRHDKYRVPIPKLVDGGDITGGYIFRREASGKGSITVAGKMYGRDWLSPVKAPGMYPHQMLYTFHTPREYEITPAQKTYITGYMAKFEALMAADTWADPAKGYRSMLDVPTMAEYAIMQELSNNVDGYWKSVYYVKPPDTAPGGGKLQLTPVWDFNLGFGNADYREGWKNSVSNLKVLTTFGGECQGQVNGPPICDGLCCQHTAAMNTCKTKCWNMPIVAFYFERLWGENAFQNDLKCRWQALRKGPISMTFIDARIAGYKAAIVPKAMPRHFAKWPALRAYVWPNPYVVDKTSAPVAGDTVQTFFDKEVVWFRNWMDARIKWMDANLPGTCMQ